MTRDLTNTSLRELGTLPIGPAKGNPVTDDPLMVYGENWRGTLGWPLGMGLRYWFHPLDAAQKAVNDKHNAP